MGRFDGKGVIVTGAGRGIGQATAQRFASEGADVMLVGRTPAAAGGDRRADPRRGRQGLGAPLRRDATRPRCAAPWRRRRRAGAAASTCSINNAGIDDETPFLEMTEESWRAVVDTNLTGPFLFSRAVAPEMVHAGGGVILHNASIDASGGDGPFASYNASKAGLLGLNRTMALELGPHGIRVNCVSPGFTHTDMTERAVGPGDDGATSTASSRACRCAAS